MLWSFAPHDISMLLSLVNDNVSSVFCEGVDGLGQGLADTATVHIQFKNLLKARISCSWLYPEKEQKLVVVGSKGMAVFDDTRPWSEKLTICPLEIDPSIVPPHAQKGELEYISVAESEPLREECQYFLDLIQGRVLPRTDGLEGRAVLELLSLASESMAKGVRVYA